MKAQSKLLVWRPFILLLKGHFGAEQAFTSRPLFQVSAEKQRWSLSALFLVLCNTCSVKAEQNMDFNVLEKHI